MKIKNTLSNAEALVIGIFLVTYFQEKEIVR